MEGFSHHPSPLIAEKPGRAVTFWKGPSPPESALYSEGVNFCQGSSSPKEGGGDATLYSQRYSQ